MPRGEISHSGDVAMNVGGGRRDGRTLDSSADQTREALDREETQRGLYFNQLQSCHGYFQLYIHGGLCPQIVCTVRASLTTHSTPLRERNG